MDSLITWALGALATLGTIAAIYFKGRSKGKAEQKAKEAEAQLEVERKLNEKVQQANKVAVDIANASSDDVRKRLRDNYSRD